MVILLVVLLAAMVAAPVLTLRRRASRPGLLVDAHETMAMHRLVRIARSAFPEESRAFHELRRAGRVVSNNGGPNVGAYLTPEQVRIPWPFLRERVVTLLAQRVDRTSYADATTVGGEQDELYLYRRFIVRMRSKGLAPPGGSPASEEG